MGIDQFRRLQNHLANLRAAWEEMPQSRGGVVALRGFHYQLATALGQLVLNWCRKSESERSRPWTGLIIEGLSDWTNESREGVVACQVKLTQSSEAVRSALTEFWLIDRLALQHVPELHTKLQFRIVSRQATLRNAGGTIARWIPNQTVSAAELDRFRRKVSVALDPDPEIELLAVLANQFHARDPLERLSGWFGRLLRGSSTERGFDEALLSIWSDLQTMQAEDWTHRSPGYLWTSRDKPPESLAMGPVLVGQRPTVEHLRSGYFANRGKIYDNLVSEVEAWVMSSTDRATGKIRMFWIGGRSGSGKTVALLHILAQLHEHGNGVVLWLEDKLRLLPEAVRWCRPLLREGRTVIIGIDDLYNPLNQADTDSVLAEFDAELMVLRQQSGSASTPHILCSGPNEQRARLRKDNSSIVDVSFADLPIETPQELQNIWKWFCSRTGQQKPLPYHAKSDVLLVQLFFEWRTGQPIADFAARFRKRIRGMDQQPARPLEEFLSRMLALNRLYAGYSTGALRELCRELLFETAFRRLQDEEHHLVVEEFGATSGLRLTHPHLANALYEAWYDAVDDRAFRITHLRRGIADAISYNSEPRERVAPLWAVVRSSARSQGGELSQRLSPELLEALLPEVYSLLNNQFGPELPIWLIPVWVEIQAQFPELALLPSPIDRALLVVSQGRIHEKGLRLTCHKLLQHHSKFRPEYAAKMTSSVRSLLLENSSWHEWGAVAADYVAKIHSHDLNPAIRRWVSFHRTHQDAASLLQAVLRRCPDQEVLDAALLWLASSNAEYPAWSFVWQDLLRAFPADPSVLKAGDSWLDRTHPNNPSWGYVWQDLNRAKPQDEVLLQKGRRWLEATNLESGSWAYVWQDLRSAEPHLADLVDCALGWLDSVDLNNRSWTFVWEDLWEAMPDDVRLIERGRRWLENSDRAQPSWTFMWQHLWSAQPRADYLVDLGVQWLDQAEPSDAVWYFVWNDLSDVYPDLVMQRACVRLQETDSHSPEWPRLWLNAYRLKLPSQQFKDLGRKWLSEAAFDRPEWAEVWQASYTLAPHDVSLENLGEGWLDASEPSSSDWGLVWKTLQKKGDSTDSRLHRAKKWLSESYANGTCWGLVWDAVHGFQDDDADLLTLGERWLNDADPEDRYWCLVWRGLYRSIPDNVNLLGQALDWLEMASLRNPSWGMIWVLLFIIRPREPMLVDRGKLWLENASGHSVWYGFVWGALVESCPDDPRIRSIGRQWLDGANPKVGCWRQNWDVFRREHGNDESLLNLGLKWIRQADPNSKFWGFAWGTLRKTWPLTPEFQHEGFEWLLHAAVDNPSWSYVWSVLRNIQPQDPRLSDSLRRFAAEAAPENSAWVTIWQPLVKMLGTGEIAACIRRLLGKNTNSRVWPAIWMSAYEAGFVTKELLEAAREWLLQTPFNGSQWRYVWEIVYRVPGKDERLFEHARACLTAPYVKRTEAWRKLWGTLFKANPQDEELFCIGVEWLGETTSEVAQWRETLQVLLRKRPKDENLFSLGVRSLSTLQLGLDAWQQLWQALVAVRRDDSAMIEIGQEKLRRADITEQGWDRLWSSLFKVDSANPDLFRLGEVWIRAQNKLTHSVALVLGALCKADPANEYLFGYTRELLSTTGNGSAWGQLWLAIFEIRPEDPQLLKCALRFLDEEPQSPMWGTVWARLRQHYPHLDQLKTLAQSWLASHFRAQQWSMVWLAVCSNDGGNEPLIQLAQQWLRGSPGGINGWPAVWAAVHQDRPSDPELLRVGREWLDNVPLSQAGWALVWKRLFEADPEPTALGKAVSWLGCPSHASQEWAEVWKVCWAQRPGNEYLIHVGIEMLDRTLADVWAIVWFALLSKTEQQANLIEKALQWLPKISANSRSWLPVWLELHRLRPHDERILSCAQQRLDLISEEDSDRLVLLEILSSTKQKSAGGMPQ